MSIETNLMEMNKSLKKLKESGVYDVEKYSYASNQSIRIFLLSSCKRWRL